MKIIQVKVSNLYALAVPDNMTAKEDIMNCFKGYIERNNMTAENEFWDNASIVCSDCGISLQSSEEEEMGKCHQCGNPEVE